MVASPMIHATQVVTGSGQLRHRLLAQIVQDTDGNEQILPQTRQVDVAECKGSLSQAPELGAETVFVQTMADGSRQLLSADHRHFVLLARPADPPTRPGELQWLALESH